MNGQTVAPTNSNVLGKNGQSAGDKPEEVAESTDQEILWDGQELTLDDAYMERPPSKYIVESIFEEATLNMLYGPPGSFKSFVAADLTACIAGNKPWLKPDDDSSGCFFKVSHVKAMWIDFDNGTSRTLERFGVLGQTHDINPKSPLAIYSLPTPPLNAGDAKMMEQLNELITRNGVEFVVIDNLGNISGGADENSAAMIPIMDRLRRLTQDTRATILLIHHSRKSNGNNSVRAGDALRGFSGIEAALDTALKISREENSFVVRLTSTKSRGAEIPHITAKFVHELSQNGKLVRAKFVSTSGASSATRLSIQEKLVIKTILEKVSAKGTKKSALETVVCNELRPAGISRRTVRQAIESLIRENRLVVSSGNGNTKILSLSPTRDK